MNWKITRDRYLRPVADAWGEEAVKEAGFFADDDPTDAALDDVRWLCTPTETVRRNLTVGENSGRPIVLLSTGGFYPLHHGHIAMMNRARERAEAEGWWIVGGYLSPGHDAYLRQKSAGPVAPASERIARLADAVATTGWLSVDPWEALHRRVAVNYTDVTARLQEYLRCHIDPRIDVCFVCGGDNARFSLAFARRGRCIVVGRPRAEETLSRWRADPRVAQPDRILWAEGDHHGASSALRPRAWDQGAHRVVLRLEDARSVQLLGLDPDRWRRFQERLIVELNSVVEVATATAEGQTSARVSGTISLDPLLPGEANLGISRLFEFGGYHQLGHVARPGWPQLDRQFADIRPGRWILRDDDRSSGATLDFVRNRLGPLVHVTKVIVALDANGGDIADSRDFLVGTNDGGLVVALPDGSVGRAPYLLPYVDPSARCGIPPQHSVTFSSAVWELNAEAFAGTRLRVADLPPATAATFSNAGHEPGTPLSDVCRHHAETLAGLRAPASQSPVEELR